MPWFKVKERNGETYYLHSFSKEKVFHEFICHQKWGVEIISWTPKKLDYKSLLLFYEELYNALQSGVQLKEAIVHLSSFSSKPNIAIICKALISELNKGKQLNTILTELVESTAEPYCKLINTNATKEACLVSLQISINQLTMLLKCTKRLLKSILYPFFLIQLSLIILIANSILTNQTNDDVISLSSIIGLYVVASMIQIFLIHHFLKGAACHWLERYSISFRLNKLLSLLIAIRGAGASLQEGLLRATQYFTYREFKAEILAVYYQLKLGNSYLESFPHHWFPKSSCAALHSAQHDGTIERALTQAKLEHEQDWQRKIELLEKLLPALCLFIAAGFVAHTLIKLYIPLLELSYNGN